jgi:hypothetical protein
MTCGGVLALLAARLAGDGCLRRPICNGQLRSRIRFVGSRWSEKQLAVVTGSSSTMGLTSRSIKRVIASYIQTSYRKSPRQTSMSNFEFYE